MPLDFACPDWAEKLARGETPIADLDLDAEAAERAVRVFNMLRLPDVMGQPSLGEGAGEWIRDIVRAIFGSVVPVDGLRDSVTRQVGEVFILVPKKNAKTTSAAAIALTFMLLNKRRNADMLIIGPTQKISEVAFEQAKGIIEADPEGFLQKRFHIRDHQKTIKCRTTGARLMVRTFGMDVLTGAKPVFALIDEIHLLGAIAYAADVIRQIRGGMMPFPESVLVMITTQSDHPPAGAFRTELDYARGVRDGIIKDRVRLLPVLYEFPLAMQTDKDQPWADPKYWHMVTPNLGLSISMEALQDGYERARQDGHAELVAWATQHLNVEVGVALHGTSWPGALYWDQCARPGLDLDALLDRSEVCTIGVDWGGSDDLASVYVLGRDRETKAWLGWSRSWARPTVFERRKNIAAMLRRFEADGDLEIVQTGEQQAQAAVAICVRVRDSGLLPAENALGLDVAGVALLLDALEGAGMVQPQVMAVGQGWKLQQAVSTLPLKLEEGRFLHGGQPIMAWAVGNAQMELKGSNWVITKQVAGAAKIDPLMALFDAAMLMMLNPGTQAPSYLESESLVFA